MTPPAYDQTLRALLRALPAGSVDESVAHVRVTEAARNGIVSPIRVLVDEGLVAEDVLERAVWQYAGYRYVELDPTTIDPEGFGGRWTVEVARRTQAIPLQINGDGAQVAMLDPTSIDALDELTNRLGVPVREVFITDAAAIHVAITRMEQASVGSILIDTSRLSVAQEAEDETTEEAGSYSAAVRKLIEQAVTAGASDIHVEPSTNRVGIRFRLDGDLQPQPSQPAGAANGLVNRIKILSNLDVGERRMPQSGKITYSVAGRQVDLRVEIEPTVHGEDAVVRILDPENVPKTLLEVGFSHAQAEQFSRLIHMPHGAVIMTGPTGSGKTTTLNVGLRLLNTPNRKVLSVEDPVEYTIDGVRQVSVDYPAGRTFPVVLRSMLRQDPDVILVGEARDTETAKVATQAALTGHMVLTTLHANTAPAAPARLIEMGVDAFLVASALRAVVSQRLIKKLCTYCRIPYEPTEQDLLLAAWPARLPMPELLYSAKPKGCGRCNHTGYRGRTSVIEVMEVNDKVAAAINRGASDLELEELSLENGMIPLREDALTKAAGGVTSLEAVRAVAF
ncbi:MAG TPA: ATPase, T2SS/T4P/T4SS family [Acidimicrobiales bacterium]|nr:ATPase, T2SS/T4P/T4SS family [Acidimicrobiales bacterium]